MLIFSLLLFLCSCGNSSDRVLNVFMWSDYIQPSVIAQFENEYGCRVIVDTYDSNESMYAKLKLGAAGYDILIPSNYYLDVMQQQGMLTPLETGQIPNLSSLDPRYLKLVGETPLRYGIPYMVTMTGIAYRTDKVNDFIPTWRMFGRQDLRGRMTLLNDLREALGAGLISDGANVNTVDPTQIQNAAKTLISWKKNLAKFESEQYKNGIASAEFLVVQGYSGDILQVQRENPSVAFAFPEEGAMISVDYLVIPRDGTHRDLAYAFINFLLRPEIAARNMEFTLYLAPNKDAYPLLNENLRANPTLFPPESVLEKLQLVRNVGEATPLFNRAWDLVKSTN